MNGEGSSASNNTSATGIEDERARLRRNQRNSRARKQAYVQDLEQRWSECVRLGAQATIEMQREARRVQEENRLLRALLHQQGWDDMAIQEAAAVLRQGGGNEIQLPTAHSSIEHLMATSIDIAAPGMLNKTRSAGPQSGPRELPQARSFVGNPAPSEILTDIPQELNFNDWLTDLCNIKDAFGIDMFAPDQLFQHGGDRFGTPPELSPQLAIGDAQGSQPLSMDGDTGSSDLDQLQERDCGNPDWGNT
ncbi:hypothetical protein HD806DRAFT_502669 [Xylariaceae sp. AK1471]|nr:hypothetical protein HD806DRAFT_502669 [Xylariaceae sp. AK1471]